MQLGTADEKWSVLQYTTIFMQSHSESDEMDREDNAKVSGIEWSSKEGSGSHFLMPMEAKC